jgi:hypothetical protein
MNNKLKQVSTWGSRASKSIFQGSSSSSSRREAMLRCARDEQRSIAFQRPDDEEEKERGEEERRGEEAENVGEGPMRRRVSRLSLSMCRGRLGGATWLLLLLRPYGKRIAF